MKRITLVITLCLALFSSDARAQTISGGGSSSGPVSGTQTILTNGNVGQVIKGIGSGFATPAKVQGSSQGICSGGNTASFGSNVTAGNTLVVVYMEFNTQSVTISDSLSNSFTSVSSVATGPGAFYVWTAPVTTSGADTVTITNNFGCNDIALWEFSGLVTASVSDGAALSGGSNLPSSFTTGSVTTTQAADLILTYLGYQCGGCGSFTSTVSSGYSTPAGDGQIWVAYKTVTSTGSYSATWNPSGNVLNRSYGYGEIALKAGPPVETHDLLDFQNSAGTVISSISVAGNFVGGTIYTGSASNKDSAGQITLSAGSGTYNFTGAYASAPICTATDTTGTNAVKVATTTTTLTLTGTGTDVVNYLCHGRN